jgi:hypothetical protein
VRATRAPRESILVTTQRSLWEEINQLFTAINQSHAEWGVPPFNGGLFVREKQNSPLSHALAQIKLNKRDFGPVLFHLLVDDGPEDLLPVDLTVSAWRERSYRRIQHVYATTAISHYACAYS